MDLGFTPQLTVRIIGNSDHLPEPRRGRIPEVLDQPFGNRQIMVRVSQKANIALGADEPSDFIRKVVVLNYPLPNPFEADGALALGVGEHLLVLLNTHIVLTRKRLGSILAVIGTEPTIRVTANLGITQRAGVTVGFGLRVLDGTRGRVFILTRLAVRKLARRSR